MSTCILRILTIFVVLMHDAYSLNRNLGLCLCFWYKQQTCQESQMTTKQAPGTPLQCTPAGPCFLGANDSDLFQIGRAQRAQTCPLPHGQTHPWERPVLLMSRNSYSHSFSSHLLWLVWNPHILWNGWVYPLHKSSKVSSSWFWWTPLLLGLFHP